MAKTVLSELIVQMTVENAQFQKELEKATAKQAALANQSNKTSLSLKNIDAQFQKGVGAVAGFAKVTAGLAASFGAISALASNNAREIKNLSGLAGVGAEEFQSYAFAFKQFGIEQDKFADITKDTREKLGEFIATGGGGFKDFFEQVAPKVGITAKELAKLSGPQVLVKVKESMDSLNLSAQQQSFYLESIASDATLLAPALTNGAEKLNELRSEFDGLGLAISESDINQLSVGAKNFDLLAARGKLLASVFVNQVTPSVDEFAGYLVESTPAAIESARKWFNLLAAGATISVQKVVDAFVYYYETLEQLPFGLGEAYTATREDLQKLSSDLQGTVDGIFDQTMGIGTAKDTFLSYNSAVNLTTEQNQAVAESFIVAGDAADSYAERLRLSYESAQITMPKLPSLDEWITEQEQLASAASASLQNSVLSNLQIVTSGLAQSGQEAGGVYQALFALQKAAAIPSIIINTQDAAMKARTIDPTGVLSAITLASGAAAVGIAAAQTLNLSGARKMGGSAIYNQSYLVGENGPEIFTPNANGQITSNENAKKAFGGDTERGNLTVNITADTDPAKWYAENRDRIIKDIYVGMARA